MCVSNLQADIDNNGTIDYGEFIAAMLHLHRVDKDVIHAEEVIQEADRP